MSHHTPTPWRNVCFQVYGSDGSRVAHTGVGQLPPSRAPESEANAYFIVRAVNSHDDLMIALQAAQGQIMNVKIDLQTGHTKAAGIKTLDGIITFIDNAIAKVSQDQSR